MLAGELPTLHAFVDGIGETLTLDQRVEILDQAMALLSQAYAHLPHKQAMTGIDPLQRIRRLRHRLAGMSELGFHDELRDIFNDLRDLHTAYLLPAPYRGKTALLPFLVEAFHEGGRRRYMVSKLARGLDDPWFRRGVTITHWNGAPIERAVERNAERLPGANDAARHAQGLHAMTVRPLAVTPIPDEDWVTVTYLDASAETREIRFDWRVTEHAASVFGPAADDLDAASAGVDLAAEATRRAHQAMFALSETSGAEADSSPESAMPDNFSFRVLTSPRGRLGYVRIWSFENTRAPAVGVVAFVEAFVAEFLRVLSLLPQDGLILDIRRNPGGRIPAGERLLELLTPRRIEPALLQFRGTPLVADLCRSAPPVLEIQDSAEAVEHALATGSVYSVGKPFMPFARGYNRIGQRYHGPVLLIVDALCYSTSDFFAAGFQDNGIGPVLGTHACTGAGGANAWEHDTLERFLRGEGRSPFRPLPGGAGMTVALRRSTRVGAHAGQAVEDFGVEPDHLHALTRDDLLLGNKDLLARAEEILATMPRRTLEVAIAKGPAPALIVRTSGFERLDLYLDGRPWCSLDVEPGERTVPLPPHVPPRFEVDAQGFAQGVLCARRRETFASGGS